MKKFLILLLVCVLSLSALFGCAGNTAGSNGESSNQEQSESGGSSGGSGGGAGTSGGSSGGSTSGGSSGTVTETEGETAEETDSDKTDIPSDLPSQTSVPDIACSEGTANCWSISGTTITFFGITEKTVCSISGEYNGNIVIDVGDDYKFELELNGFTIYSDQVNPITVLSGDKVTLTAKKGTQNYVYDKREAISDDDETSYSSAIYAECDLVLGGKGELVVISENNNGVHTKDDLEVKNLTLSVTCEDNALKGNDSVTITSGTLTLIAKTGDGIKTTNTDVSSKGNQRGTVEVLSGTVDICAACDGIDAAYNVTVSDTAVLNIYTDRYSPYSETVETKQSQKYIRFTSNAYNYSVKYYNDDSDYQWVNATYSKSVNDGRYTYYYYTVDSLSGYSSFQLYVYSSSQTQGQDSDYVTKTDYLTWNNSYDTLALESRRGSLSYNWTNYTTSVGGMGGMGGMSDGNTEKGEYSTKGIKAGNEILISGGTITVNSYDDAIHANGGETLENEETSTGNVTISGGTLKLFSKDDAVHADGTLNITGGSITVTGSYEGLEGLYVNVSGGDLSITSTDDGVNATTTSGIGINITGGNLYVYAGGDGLDSNSKTQYNGIVFGGGTVVIVSTSGGNSSIDTENGYTYTAGSVLAICPSNSMTQEVTNCKNFTSIATKTTLSLSNGQTVKVTVDGSEVLTTTMPCGLSAFVVYLGSDSAKIATA